MNFSRIEKLFLTIVLMVTTGVSSVFAQDGISTGINTATTTLKTYITPITSLAYVIAAIVGIIGAIRIYNKWQGGDRDINKEVMGYGGAAVFLLLAPTVVKAIFGV
jgi:capsular polysaccharide biosynthesis protein